MGLIGSIIAGLIAGYLACKLTKRQGKGFLANLLLGVGGSIAGHWLFGNLGIVWGGLIGQIGTATLGAIILLWLWNALTK